MDINSAFPSQYLKASDLQGREITITMARVVMEKIGTDTKPVLYFQGTDKGMALNKTNSMTIASAYGPNTDGWAGNKIILYSAWVDYQGKQVQGLRVRPAYQQANAGQAPQQPAQPLPMVGGQPGFVGAGQAGPLPPAQPQGGPPPGHPASFPNDTIPF